MRAKIRRAPAPTERKPDSSWTKDEIKDYLEFHDVEHTSSMTKDELLGTLEG